MSAGSSEDWRPDDDRFPDRVRGKKLDGWPGEHWLDIRQLDVLKPIMRARLDRSRGKGFDGVDFDNVHLERAEFCAQSRRRSFSSLRKRLSLGSWRAACRR